MFWKFIFVLYAILLFVFGFYSAMGDNNSLQNSSNLECVFGVLVICILYLFFNLLYGLARKARTMTINVAKLGIAAITFANLALALFVLFKVNPCSVNFAFILAILEIVFVLLAIILLPLYIPLIAYTKNYFKFRKDLKNKFFSTFAIMFLLSISLPCLFYDIYLLIIGDVGANIWKSLIDIFSEMFVVLCTCGYIFRKDFINRKALKLLCIPAVIVHEIGLSLTELKSDIMNILNDPLVGNLFALTMIILEIIIIYRYCYTDVVKNGRDFIEVKTEDKPAEPNKLVVEFKQRNRVSKIAYICIILFLGNLGIHKFYAGKHRIGAIYLLLYWTGIPFVVSFVEFFMACFQTTDEYGEIEV